LAATRYERELQDVEAAIGLATNHLIAASDLPCGSDACREGALQRANVSGGAEGGRVAPLRGSRRSRRRTACFCG
jgi:hypothetical protein